MQIFKAISLLSLFQILLLSSLNAQVAFGAIDNSIPQVYAQGDTVRLPIALGSGTQNLAENFQSVSFNIYLPDILYDNAFIEYDQVQGQSWIFSQDSSAQFNSFYQNDTLTVSIIRQPTPISGTGNICDLRIVIDDNIVGVSPPIIAPINFNVTVIKNDGTLMPLDIFDGTVMITTTNEIGTITKGKLKVYPNPAQEVLVLESTENVIEQVRIFDQMGRLVSEEQSEDKILNITLDGIPPGMYHLSVETNNGRVHKKFIKK